MSRRQAIGRRIQKACEAHPVTTLLILTSVCLYAAVELTQTLHGVGFEDALRQCGGVSVLTVRGLPQLYGPLDLWDGQFLRVFVSAFHHGGLFHLAMNGLAIAFCGGLLESRLGSTRYLAFVLAATAVSFLPEYLRQQVAVGLSGVVYAMFGLLLVLRRHDRPLAHVVTDQLVRLALGWLVLCFVLSYFRVWLIANGAHVAGLAYGWTVGWVFYDRPARSAWARRAFLAAHALIPVGFYFVTHPVWVGRYQWYVGLYHQDEPEVYVERLARAVRLDPGLTQAWEQLTMAFLREGEVWKGWRTLLNALKLNRSDEQLVRLARLVWQQLSRPAETEHALRILGEVFGAEKTAWVERLKLFEFDDRRWPLGLPVLAGPAVRWLPSELRYDGWRELLDDSLLGRTATRRALGVDPEAPDSACEGVSI